ncbi:uncharacterized protein BDZ99DRAFT_534191 [Mytilinidion resinicola]|uniref:RING-type domain-containing protein n=1 Tax=Mytilinidion resinicola TaxID=574789 RepID=A0A6A6YHG3_9PEZI|nr:uncharacterized protein BDZ99DRAFT_534191 [Mytilinidion resinicola]KAF2808256.1 hypothetical protein BDZ99DRAFT_534191 [Mytilinidion resinicola]
MSAEDIGVFTIEFPDPFTLSYYNEKFETLDSNVSFQYPILDGIRTLSTNGASNGDNPYGILYVPNLTSNDCIQAEKHHVPANATRRKNLPDVDYSLIAVAPWFSPTCQEEYFAAARSSPVKAFFTYLPSNSSETPPLISDPAWGLGDGGSWKSKNSFPVYALPGITGAIVMQQLNLYSGNITTVPNGRELVDIGYPPSSYVRLWANVDTGSGSQLPSLWVFLLVVLALLCIIAGGSSCFLHVLQRRRRRDLRTRIVNGQVDLEALGIKKLTVPQEYLDKMPVYNYTREATAAEEKEEELLVGPQPLPQARLSLKPSQVPSESGNPLVRRSSAPSPSTPTEHAHPAFSQPTCPICLDDFEPNVTPIRELPCRHIFHPDCVDTFLLNNSSLCPMCKKSTLPDGYCPDTITNAMVRRERYIRRYRQRAQSGTPPEVNAFIGRIRRLTGRGNRSSQFQTVAMSPPAPAPAVATQSGSRGHGFMSGNIFHAISERRNFSAPVRPPPDIEMGNAPVQPSTILENHVAATVSSIAEPPTLSPSTSPTCDLIPANSQTRREWARQRALELLRSRHSPEVAALEEAEARRERGWRKVLGKIFPSA